MTENSWIMPSLIKLFSVILTRHQPELSYLSPYELSVFRMDDAQPHQAILSHPHKAPPCHLLFQKRLTVQVVEISTVPPQPLLHVNNTPLSHRLRPLGISRSANCRSRCFDLGRQLFDSHIDLSPQAHYLL